MYEVIRNYSEHYFTTLMLISTILKHFYFKHFSLYEWPLVWIDSLIHKVMNEQEFTMN